jgi:hypothetical protein
MIFFVVNCSQFAKNNLETYYFITTFLFLGKSLPKNENAFQKLPKLAKTTYNMKYFKRFFYFNILNVDKFDSIFLWMITTWATSQNLGKGAGGGETTRHRLQKSLTLPNIPRSYFRNLGGN